MNNINLNDKQEEELLERSHLIEKEEKKQNPFFRILKLSIFIFLIVWFLIYNWYSNFKTNILVKKETIIEIKKWEVANDLSEKLNINKNYLKLYLKQNNPDFELIIWKFKIEENSDITKVLDWLKEPLIEDEIDITLLEGWNIYDIDEYLVKQKLIEKWDYIKYSNNIEKIKELTKFFPFIEWLETLEWFLYPDTYRVVSNNFKINVFIIKQLENFENKIYTKVLKEFDNENIEEIINLASIVEKEEKNSSEKSTVAWILKKRK